MSAGYSGTPLAKKLGFKEGMRIVVLDAPPNYRDLIEPVPYDVTITTNLEADAEMVHLFSNSVDGLRDGLARITKAIRQNGAIWVSWYKKAAKLTTEINEDVVREAAFPLGLVDVKVCAVDEKWSALKLVIRRENRI